MPSLTYSDPGATHPASGIWDRGAVPRGYERTIRIGEDSRCWDQAVTSLLRWGIKTSSGFTVSSSLPAAEGADLLITFRWGPLAVREPVRVVQVVDLPDRQGFAYGTRPGHPVSGEEAFVLHRGTDGSVHFTLRSTTSAGTGVWRWAFPLALLAQRRFRRRYLRAAAQLAPTLTYPEVGATAGELPAGYQHLRASRVVGEGRELFEQCAETILTWGVQRGAGLTVDPGNRVAAGDVNRLGLGWGPLRTSAPCQVVYVVDEPDRKGFAYGTLRGHPECGEESFVVSIDESGSVEFEVTAFSRPARWFARLGGPVTRVIQRHVTWRYLEAVHPEG